MTTMTNTEAMLETYCPDCCHYSRPVLHQGQEAMVTFGDGWKPCEILSHEHVGAQVLYLVRLYTLSPSFSKAYQWGQNLKGLEDFARSQLLQ